MQKLPKKNDSAYITKYGFVILSLLFNEKIRDDCVEDISSQERDIIVLVYIIPGTRVGRPVLNNVFNVII